MFLVLSSTAVLEAQLQKAEQDMTQARNFYLTFSEGFLDPKADPSIKLPGHWSSYLMLELPTSQLGRDLAYSSRLYSRFELTFTRLSGLMLAFFHHHTGL